MLLPKTVLPNMFEITDIITIFTVQIDATFRTPNSASSDDFWMMYFVESGTYHISINGVAHEMEAGNIFFRAPGQTFSKGNGFSNCTMCQIAFMAPENQMECFRNRIFSTTPQIYTLARNLFSTGTKLFYWNEGFCDGCGMSPYPDVRSTDLYNVKLSMQMLLNQLCAQNNAAGAADTYKKQACERDLFAQAMAYMNRNLSNPISIGEIAGELGISASAVQKLFAAKANTTMVKYFAALRLTRAKQLLENGKSISETADALGFSSPSYFSRWFKKEAGLPPSQYKA